MSRYGSTAAAAAEASPKESEPTVRNSPSDGMNGKGRRPYPFGPKIWKSDCHEVVLTMVMLYHDKPGAASREESLLEPFTPPKVKYHKAEFPATKTFSFSV